MQTLLVRLTYRPQDEADNQAEWLVLDDNRLPTSEQGRGDINEVANLAKQRRVCLVLPAAEIFLTTTALKVRNRQQLARAVPYALEENLADDVESLHFSIAPETDNDTYSVAVISKSRLELFLEAARNAGITADFATSELLCLPYESGEWSILLEDQRALVRTGTQRGFACEPENLRTLLSHALGEVEAKPQRFRVYHCTSAPVPFEQVDEEVEHVIEELCPPRLFALGFDSKTAINLLQGPYQTENPVWRTLKPWRTAAVLVGAWICLQVGLSIWDYQQLAKQESDLEKEIEAVFKATFPSARRIVNPRVQMEQRLNQLLASQRDGRKPDFLTFLDAGAQAVSSAQGVEVEDISFRDGRLVIDLTATELQSVEKVKDQIQQTGFDATIDSANTSGSRIDARLILRRAQG